MRYGIPACGVLATAQGLDGALACTHASHGTHKVGQAHLFFGRIGCLRTLAIVGLEVKGGAQCLEALDHAFFNGGRLCTGHLGRCQLGVGIFDFALMLVQAFFVAGLEALECCAQVGNSLFNCHGESLMRC